MSVPKGPLTADLGVVVTTVGSVDELGSCVIYVMLLLLTVAGAVGAPLWAVLWACMLSINVLVLWCYSDWAREESAVDAV